MNAEKMGLYLERLDDIFQQLSRRIRLELSQNLVDGITMSQFAVLNKISGKGKVTVSEAAVDLNVSLSAITALADRLYKAGLVDRSRDEQDRRLVWLTLTKDGEGIIAECRKARNQMAEKYLSRLPEEDMRHLVRIYEKILKMDGT